MCLIPEVPFALKGPKGLFAYVEKVLEERGHCVMCIAEGAGQVSPCSVLAQKNTRIHVRPLSEAWRVHSAREHVLIVAGVYLCGGGCSTNRSRHSIL